MNKDLNFSERIVLELLKSALWGGEPELDSRIKIEDRVWEEIYVISVTQGVLAIVFEGALKLPEIQYPPEELMLRWSVNVKLVEKRYAFSEDAVLALNNVFADKSVEMLLLKGLSLSMYYPKPAHREYGDIDMYLFGSKSDVDCSTLQLFETSTKPVQKGIKHSLFYYKQMPVEYHVNFLNVNRFRTFFDRKQKEKEIKIETALLNLLQTEKTEWLDGKVRVPSATFNYIFLACHTAIHFPRGIVLRHLCDWACFLSQNKGRYDEAYIKRVFNNSRFNQFGTLFTGLSIQYLGLSSSCAPDMYIENTNNVLERQIILDILRPFPKSCSNSIYGDFMWNIDRFFRDHWKYKLIYGDTIAHRVLRILHWWLCKTLNVSKLSIFKNLVMKTKE